MAKKIKITKKQVVTSLVAVLLVAGAMGLGFLVRQMQQAGSANDPQQNESATAAAKLPALITEVQDLNAQGKAEEANKKAEEALKNPDTTNDTKYALYIQQGNAKANANDRDGAANLYIKAYDLKKTLEVTNLLGETYTQIGDTAKAIRFYEEALALVPANSPLARDERASITMKIDYLKGQR